MEQNTKPRVYSLYESPLKPEEIEAKSFEAIDREAGDHGFKEDEWIIVRRMIHTTADFSLARDVRMDDGVIAAACGALREGRPIYTDSNMIRSGISAARLQAVNSAYTKDDVRCHVADEEVADEAKRSGLPRSLFAVRKAKDWLDGAIALIGNAPVALLELNRMIVEENIRPAAVIGMPVGFVHVVESKEELMSLDVPYITITGRRGGSPLAVSVLHSLCAIAANGEEQR